MKAAVTGATGFIGGNLVRELLDQGASVRAVVRPGANHKAIEGLNVELAEADLLGEEEAMERAMSGCDALFHVGALYTYWPPDHSLAYRTNVEGTKKVLNAARKAGVKRAVHTSSSAAIGLPRDGAPGTEETPVDTRGLLAGYKRSKYLSEVEALKAGMSGLETVIVNPTTPVGQGDVKPTPTGRIIVDFLKQRMFGYLETGLNLIHVRDVAKGHVLAFEKGKAGHRYILGNRDMTLREIFLALAGITGLKPPKIRIPYWFALAFAHADEAIEGRLLRRAPRATTAEVRLAKKRMFFDPGKARAELGLPQTSVETGLAEAVGWFREHGYA